MTMDALVAAYRHTRNRMCAVMLEASEQERAAVVPACAPWTCHDLLAHVMSMPAAFAAGRRPDREISEWLGVLVDERRDDSAESLIAEWLALDAAMPGLLEGPSAVLFGDLAVHEHDLRGAVGRPDHTALEIDVIMPRTLAGLAQPLRAAGLGAIAVEHDGHRWHSHDAEPGWTLLTDPWTAVRAVNSRRTAAELRTLPAHGDVEPYLQILDEHLPLPATSLGES